MPQQSMFVKSFFYCTFISLAFFILVFISDSRNNLREYYYKTEVDRILQNPDPTSINKITRHLPTDMKYILQWTSPTNSPFVYMGRGQSTFIESQCRYINCFVTHDRNLLGGDYSNFDAIAFNGPEIVWMRQDKLPEKRSPHQKYVFASIESAHYYPVCNSVFDGFFNWTWTYKLNSDGRWGYIVIRDNKGKIIGPNTDMHWVKDMEPISDDLKKQLKSKKKAAAWFVSNCNSISERERFVKEVQMELKIYNLEVDIYGDCGPLKCPRNKESVCWKMLEEDYYFYFSFENSFSEDYVTEKLLHALKHNTVPVVFGGANYSRFMPEGIYLNGRELGSKKLAHSMYEIIQDKERYYEFFKWKKYYSYYRRVESVETNDYCGMCAMLNNEELVKTTTIYEHFRDWWNPKTTKC